MDRANDESERARWTGRTSSLSRRAFLAMATGLAGGAAISGVLGARRFFEDGWNKQNLALVDEMFSADHVDHSLPP